MYRLVDEHCDVHGVEPICAVQQIAPSAYRRHAARRRNPQLLGARAQRDAALMSTIERVWSDNLQVYDADKAATATSAIESASAPTRASSAIVASSSCTCLSGH